MILKQIVELKEKGLTYRQIGARLGLTAGAVRGRHRRWKESHPDGGFDEEEPLLFSGISIDSVVATLRRNPHSVRQLSEVFNRSEQSILDTITYMQGIGYSINEERHILSVPPVPAIEPEISPLFNDGAKEYEFSFALMSDTHSGSRAEQPTALQNFGKIAQEEYGCRVAIHTGDVVAGNKVYRGQENDIYCSRGMDQAEVAANNLPRGFDKIYVLGGNHDYSYYKLSGLDVRNEIVAAGRDDIELLPFDAYDLSLTDDIDARLWHPSGGPAYAISYKGQKYVEQLAGHELFDIVLGEKPKPSIMMVLIGHFHKTFSFRQGPISIMGGGCFEGTNSLSKRKGYVPEICGVIVKCKVIDGFLHRLQMTRIDYREIENDWRYWWYKRQPKVERVVEKVFSFET